MKLKERFKAWRKAKIEALYFKTFPERKWKTYIEKQYFETFPNRKEKDYIEKTYFETFPDRKGMATMEIFQTRTYPTTFDFYEVIDGRLIDLAGDEYVEGMYRHIAEKMGLKLLENHFIEFESEDFMDIHMMKRIRCIIRVLPPEKRVRWPR